jgi:hypothetical protein
MGRIIHCADLIIRVDEDTVIGTNLTQWILESTDFRPTNMDTCTVSDEMSSYEKLWLISVVWLTLIVLSFLYCYFCEQRLFSSSRRLFDRNQVRRGEAGRVRPPRWWMARASSPTASAQTRSATRSTRGQFIPAPDDYIALAGQQ